MADGMTHDQAVAYTWRYHARRQPALSHGGREVTLPSMREKLTRLQEDVLLVVEQNGPVTPRDIAYHLPIGESSARGVLTRLEAKNLVAATYTGHYGTGRAYVVR